MTTHTVCRVEELPVGKHRLFTAGEAKLVVYHLDDGFFATREPSQGSGVRELKTQN